MPAYIIATIDVTDPVGFEAYRQLVAPNLHAAGGRYIVRGGKTEVLEGDWQPKRVVILEFESMDAARRWYDSPGYGPIRAIRQRTTRSDVILIEGLAAPA